MHSCLYIWVHIHTHTACPLHCAECEVVGGGVGEDVESVKLECVKCDEGYAGVLCDKCDDSDGYVEADENTCVGKGKYDCNYQVVSLCVFVISINLTLE